jgi:Flp pilus assembly protein TadG
MSRALAQDHQPGEMMKPHFAEYTRSCGEPSRMPLRSFRSRSGQVLPLLAVSVAALIALGAFAIDVGGAYTAHRRAQAAADASALGAAQFLPGSTSLATSTAQSLRNTNLPDGSINAPAYSSTYAANDTVTVTANKPLSGVFTKLFSGKTAHASAKATVGSYLGWSMNIAPWAIAKQNLVFGVTVQFKTQTAGSAGNFGGAQLPIIQSGCGLGTGGNDYRYLINNSEQSCLVKVGDVLNSKTGNLAGPTQQGLQERIVAGQNVQQNFCLTPGACPILTQQPDGSYVLTTYNHPNLIVIPVVDVIGNGSSTYTVLGFAWFIIQNYDSKNVWGMFISSNAPNGAKCPTASDPNAACPVGAYTPYGFKVIQLTG